jgi:hypothetical protein
MKTTTKSWRRFKIGKFSFRSRRSAARWYLTRSKLSQTEIARRLKVTVPCVNQVATELAR